jgi:hypothetical protein
MIIKESDNHIASRVVRIMANEHLQTDERGIMYLHGGQILLRLSILKACVLNISAIKVFS